MVQPSRPLQPPPRQARGTPAPAAALADSLWGERGDPAAAPASEPTPAPPRAARSAPATETLGRRAGTLSDELDFPEFVGSLLQGTWNAMVDSSIRQMESYADLVAAISKPLAQFRDENVTANQARDWLAAQYPADVALVQDPAGPTLAPRAAADEFGGGTSPGWLGDYGLAGQPLTPDLLEGTLLPLARDRLAGDRMQTLATLVMLGMNRIVVRDGSITARLRFRAAASDKSAVDYAVSDDPGSATPSGSWSTRGSTAYAAPVTKVSTVGVNAQTDTQLNAELFGEVKINFASETIPLDRFVDDARRTLLERAARPTLVAAPAAQRLAAPPAAAPASTMTPAPAVPPAAPVPPATPA